MYQSFKLTIIIFISCFVTSSLSQWRYDDDDGCSNGSSNKNNQRISLLSM